MKKRIIGMKCYDGYDLDHWNLLLVNKSRTYYNGSKHSTNNCGECTVVGRLNKYHSKIREGRIVYDWRFYLVQFEDGHYVDADITQIKKGKVKNPYQPKAFSIGYLGQGPYLAYDKIDTKEYTLWGKMFQRCYSEAYHKRQPTYKGCTVDPRWHNFQNFCEDIQDLEGYAEWKADSLLEGRAKYELDKDIKVSGNKIYSRDTCMFVTKKENYEESTTRNITKYLTGKTYIGTRLSDGYEEEFTNKNAFKKKHNIKHAKLENVVKGIWNQTHGWTFRVKENTQNEHNKKNI